MEILLWIVAGLSALCWVVSWAMFARLRAVPSPGARENRAGRISVVIPARNEEENIGRLLRSLRNEDPAPHEIIVVDDRSEDLTAERARELGATVLAGAPAPDGWLGKPWACEQGARAASGAWLLFLDADTEVEPGGLARLAALPAHDGDVHSVCPYHRVRAGYEQLSAFFNVIMILGMNAFSLKGSRAREIGLFGQAMLISRRQHEAVGGHALVKGEVLEHFHLAHHLRAAGASCHCWLGKGTLRMRMFPDGFRALVAGWSKGIISGAGNTARGALLGISLWLSGLIMAAVALCVAPFAVPNLVILAGALYLLHVLQLAYLFRRAGNFWILSAVTFPVGLLFYHAIFFRALRRKQKGGTIQWKGRDVA